MRQGGLAFAFGGLTALLALLSGCASVARTTPAGAPGLPDWVMVVPSSTPEVAFYVGGCAAAADTAAGIGEAVSDAREQAGRAARERITPVVEASFHDAGVETTALERASLRSLVIEPVVERLAGALRRERVFSRECAARPAAGAPGGVCDVFVLMAVDLAAWERLPIEVLSDLRKQRQSEARDSTAVKLLDWILTSYDRGDPGSEGGGANRGRP